MWKCQYRENVVASSGDGQVRPRCWVIKSLTRQCVGGKLNNNDGDNRESKQALWTTDASYCWWFVSNVYETKRPLLLGAGDYNTPKSSFCAAGAIAMQNRFITFLRSPNSSKPNRFSIWNRFPPVSYEPIQILCSSRSSWRTVYNSWAHLYVFNRSANDARRWANERQQRIRPAYLVRKVLIDKRVGERWRKCSCPQHWTLETGPRT